MQEPTALETFKAVAEIAQVNETESGVIMEGLALPYGVTSRNGMRYQTESVREAAGEYAGRPILFNHNQDVVLGHVESVEDREDGLYYRANLDAAEESVVRKIRRGDIKNVSIQASFDPAR